MQNGWEVYILECLDGSLYTGITNNISKRMKLHASGKGSKYVRARGFSKLIARKSCLNRAEAGRIEDQIKQLSKEEKIKLFT